MTVLPAALAALAVWMWPRPREAQARAVLGRSGSATRHRSGPSRRQQTSADDPAHGATASGSRESGRTWWGRRRTGGPTLDSAAVLAVVETLAPALEAGLPPGAALACAVEAVTGTAGFSSLGAGPASAPSGGRHNGSADGVLADVVTQARLGSAMGPVWRAAGAASSSPDLQLLGAAWALSESSGAPLADAARTVARMLRAGLAHARQVDGAVAGARATMNLLTVLPLGGPCVALALGIGPGALYAGRASELSLAAGVALAVAGRWWVRRLVAAVAAGPVVV